MSQDNHKNQLRLFDIAEVPIKKWLTGLWNAHHLDNNKTSSELFGEKDSETDNVFFEENGNVWVAGLEVSESDHKIDSKIDMEYWKQKKADDGLRSKYMAYMKKLAQKHEINQEDAKARELYESTTEFKFQSAINLLFAAVGTVFPHVKSVLQDSLDEKDPVKEILQELRINISPKYNIFEFSISENNQGNTYPVLHMYMRPKEDIGVLQQIKRLSDFGTPFEDCDEEDN